jgi:hypothetical protein
MESRGTINTTIELCHKEKEESQHISKMATLNRVAEAMGRS